MNGPRSARCALVEVSVRETAEARGELLARYFRPEEAAALRGRQARSVAGVLAVKRAVCALLGEATEARQVVIGYDERGAPRLISVGSLSRGDEFGTTPSPWISISISHTRDRAYGCAAIDEGAGDHLDPADTGVRR